MASGGWSRHRPRGAGSDTDGDTNEGQAVDLDAAVDGVGGDASGQLEVVGAEEAIGVIVNS